MASRLRRACSDRPVAGVPALEEQPLGLETDYKAFGGKAGLVRAIYDRGLIGTAGVPAYQRSDEMRAREADPVTIMRNWGLLTAEVAAAVTPIRLLIRAAAATDPDVAALLEQSDAERLERMHHHARFLHERGHLRDDVTLAEAADILWTCSSAELYELLVLKRGWSPRPYRLAPSRAAQPRQRSPARRPGHGAGTCVIEVADALAGRRMLRSYRALAASTARPPDRSAASMG